MKRLIHTAFAAALWACGDAPTDPTDLGALDSGSGSGPDVGSDAGRGDAADASSPVDAGVDPGQTGPTLPELTPCPEGWQSESVGPSDFCVPEATAVAIECPTWLSERDESCAVPEPPALAVPCNAGWSRGPSGECRPLDPRECTSGTAFPGDVACGPVGLECPSGRFAPDLPAEAEVIYVDPEVAGGDGSSPGEAISDISGLDLDALSDGTILAFSKGTHVVTATVTKRLVFRGACAEETTLIGSGAQSALFELEGGSAGLTLRDLTIGEGAFIGIIDTTGALIDIESVVFDGPPRALSLGGLTAVELRRVGFRNCSLAMYLESRASVVAEQVTFVGCRSAVAQNGESVVNLTSCLGAASGETREPYVFVTDASRATIDDCAFFDIDADVVRGAGQGSDVVMREVFVTGGREAGLRAIVGARIDAVELFVSDRDTIGLDAVNEGSRIKVTDGTIVGSGLAGVRARLGGSVEILDSLVARNRSVGLLAEGSAADLNAERVVVYETRSDASGQGGAGLTIRDGASAELTNVDLRRNRSFGIRVDGEGSELDATRVVIAETSPEERSERLGRGLNVQNGATAVVREADIVANHELAVFIGRAGLELADSIIRETQAQLRESIGGRGLHVVSGSEVFATRVAVIDNREAGIFVSRSTGSITNALVRGTQPTAADDSFGTGLLIQDSDGLTLEDVAVLDNHSDGIRVIASVVEGEDVIVSGTLPRARDDRLGGGLSVSEASLVEIERILVRDNRYVAIAVDGESTSASFSNLTVEDTLDQVADRRGGFGLVASDFGRISVSRGRIRRSREFGAVGTSSATIRLLDTELRDVEPPACRDSGDCEAGGHGVASLSSAEITVEDSRIDSAHDCGLVVDDRGAISVSSSTIANSAIALCDDDGGLGRITVLRNVTLENNDRDRETTSFFP